LALKDVERTFKPGTLTAVDKTLCGNGFTSRFLEITPQPGRINVLIEPNVGVIQNKQNKYTNNPYIEWRYFGDNSDFGNINELTRIIVTTPDTFRALEGDLFNRVDKILIDEVHAIPQQVSFRPVLKGFIHYVRETYANSSIVTVTATPFIRSHVDIRLIPLLPIEPVQINQTNNVRGLLENINEHPSIIFSNAKNVLLNLQKTDRTTWNGERKQYKYIETRLTVGERLGKKIYSQAVIKYNPDLHFISTKGFEGMDIDTTNADVYIIQDLNNHAEQFDITNIYQAVKRLRQTPRKINYGRIDARFDYPNIYDIIDKVERLPQGVKRSQSKLRKRIGYRQEKIYNDCIFYTYSDNGQPKANIDPEVVASYYNKYLTINYGLTAEEFNDFTENRNIEVSIDGVPSKAVRKRWSNDIRFYVRQNKDFILQAGYDKSRFVFDTIYGEPTIEDFFKQFAAHIEFRKLNDNYEPNEREEIILGDLLERLPELIDQDVKEYEKRKMSEAREYKQTRRYNETIEKEKIEYYKAHRMKLWLRLIADFVNPDISIKQKQIHHREYSHLTSLPMDTNKKIASLMGLPCYEFDVTTCAARIAYNLLGEPLPVNLYGDNKKNKYHINRLLNKISHEQRGNTSKSRYKANIIQALKKYGVTIAEKLVDRYFDMPSDAFHYETTYHEKQIINQANRIFKYEGHRRHDSLILFREPTAQELKQLQEFKYLGFGGYFEPEKVCKNYTNPQNV